MHAEGATEFAWAALFLHRLTAPRRALIPRPSGLLRLAFARRPSMRRPRSACSILSIAVAMTARAPPAGGGGVGHVRGAAVIVSPVATASATASKAARRRACSEGALLVAHAARKQSRCWLRSRLDLGRPAAPCPRASGVAKSNRYAVARFFIFYINELTTDPNHFLVDSFGYWARWRTWWNISEFGSSQKMLGFWVFLPENRL